MGQPTSKESERIAGKPAMKVNTNPPSDTSPIIDLHARDTSGKPLNGEPMDRSGDDSRTTRSNIHEDTTISGATSEPTPTPDTSALHLPPIVEISLKAATDRFEQMLLKSVDKLLDKLQTIEDNLASSLDFERKRIDDLYPYQQRFESESSDLKQEVSMLRNEVKSQKEAANKNERFSRRNNIRLVGIPEPNGMKKEGKDGVDQSSISESVDLDDTFYSNLSNGLQQDNAANIALLDELDLSDSLTSPSPNNGFTYFDALSSMEANSTEGTASQVNPENYGGFYQNLDTQSPFSTPLFSAVSPMTPQASAVPVVSPDDGLVQSERIDSSLADIDPMRVNSENVREALIADPNALGERLGSIELNATRNASMQSNDHSQGPSASRMATQRQALPDSSKTQTISGTSAKGTTATSGGYFSDYQLPEFHHFKVSVKFMSTPMLEKVVIKKGGCLLHYQPSDQAPILVPDEVERISIPVMIKNEQDSSPREFPWDNDTHKLILKNFHRGVEFYSRDGNIYVKRSSNTKLFWQSTQQEPGIAKELSRNEETEVFNWGKFQQTLGISVALGNRTNLRLPAIWFSFAQKWDRDSSPITTKLVWARVDPTRACEMVKSVKPDVRSTESQESLHTSLFLFSNEATQADY